MTKMTHVSPLNDALPPATAPFADKLRAAMDRSESYKSQRALAKALGTDGSLVGKWLKGAIPSRPHLLRLPALLDTPPDYFHIDPRDRLEELAEQVAELTKTQRGLVARLADTRTRLKRLEDERAGRRARSTRQEGSPQ